MNETILLVNDELFPAHVRPRRAPGLRLHRAGHRRAAGGAADHPGPAGLLLVTDVVMPLMRGTELADRAQAIRASVKVLLMSGYQTSDIGPSGRPFNRQVLQHRRAGQHRP